MNRKEQYKDGTNMEQFEHIKSISCYNFNYYKGFNSDLLFGLSDDDDTTEWFLINPTGENIYLGESYISQKEELHVYKERCA